MCVVGMIEIFSYNNVVVKYGMYKIYHSVY